MFTETVTIGTETVKMEWETGFRNFNVYHQNNLLGNFEDLSYLKAGQWFNLPNGEQFMVLYAQEHGLEVWYKGVEQLSGMSSGSTDFANRAANWLIGLGIFRLLFSLIFSLAQLESIGDGEQALVMAIVIADPLILIGLGIWAKMTSNPVAYWIAIAYLGLSILLTIVGGSIAGIIISSLVIYYCYEATKSGPRRKLREMAYDPNAPLDQI